MTPPQTKPRVKLTNADYMRLTPPVPDGPRYQLINGELVKMAGASDAHQVFLMWLALMLAPQTETRGIGQVRIAPYDVTVDDFNTYQPDLLYVSNARRHIFDPAGHGIIGAPDVVIEILSDSTRRRDLLEKLPVYLAAGVREVCIVDLDTQTASIYAGNSLTPARVFTAEDTLTFDAMPGVAVALEPLFARAQATP